MPEERNILNRIKETLIKSPAIVVAIAVVLAFLAIIIPVPGQLLDVLMALSIALSIIMMLTTLFVDQAIQFSVFPSLLLITTAFRLALNVSSTRLILTMGENFNVFLVKGFGEFVSGGNFIIGFIIFIVFILAQFLVITKGANRVAEVSARFLLDGMAAKMLAVDSDLQAGMINDEEAYNRRNEIRQEADFYGAMDGASKFVKGDVQLGLIITAINFIGGLILSQVGENRMSLNEALTWYGTLTVGDGLVSQVPALLISYATGIIVTRSSSKGNMSNDLVKQLTSNPLTFYISGGFIAAMGFIKGFPTIWLFLVAIILFGVGYLIDQKKKKDTQRVKAEAEAKEAAPAGKAESFHPEPMDILELDLSYPLVPLVDREKGGDLLQRITQLRQVLAYDLGLVIPPVRIRDNLQIEPNEYTVNLKGVEIARGKVIIGKLLALLPPDIDESNIPFDGEKTVDPAFGAPSIWIDADDRVKAESAGYTVVDPSNVITTHLMEMVKKHANELLTRQETKKLLDQLKQENSVVVEEALAATNLGTIQKVLQSLLTENVSIRDLTTILETISDVGSDKSLSVDQITEYVRQALARQISAQYQSAQGALEVVTVDAGLLNQMARSIREGPTGRFIDPKFSQLIQGAIKQMLERSEQAGRTPIVIIPPNLRLLFKQITERHFPRLVVISYNEVVPTVDVKIVDTIRNEQSAEAVTQNAHI